MRRLRDAVGAGRRGVGGLEQTLHALAERRVELLLVSQGFQAPGWHCRPCGYLAKLGRRCPLCGEPMDQTSDVVEYAIEHAVTHVCRVEVCVENAGSRRARRDRCPPPLLSHRLSARRPSTPGRSSPASTSAARSALVCASPWTGLSSSRSGRRRPKVRTTCATPSPRSWRALAANAGAPIGAVGVGAPGLVDRDGVLRAAPNLIGVAEMPIRDMLVERLGVPVTVDNDATCATEAEWRHGAATGASERCSSRSAQASGAASSVAACCNAERTGSCRSRGTWSSTPTAHRVCAAAGAVGSGTHRAAGSLGLRVTRRSAAARPEWSTPRVVTLKPCAVSTSPQPRVPVTLRPREILDEFAWVARARPREPHQPVRSRGDRARGRPRRRAPTCCSSRSAASTRACSTRRPTGRGRTSCPRCSASAPVRWAPHSSRRTRPAGGADRPHPRGVDLSPGCFPALELASRRLLAGLDESCRRRRSA